MTAINFLSLPVIIVILGAFGWFACLIKKNDVQILCLLSLLHYYCICSKLRRIMFLGSCLIPIFSKFYV